MEWILDHKEAFQGKRVLELGAGSGLCGQMLQCVVEDCRVTMSDYCDEVVEYILGNVEESSFICACFRSRFGCVSEHGNRATLRGDR